jgi:hypothetical protein
MDHAYASDDHNKLTERYILGELPDAQAEEFEEHFFDCEQCADDVRSELTFVEGLRDATAGHPAVIPPALPFTRRGRRTLTWLPAAAAAAIVFFALAVPRMQRDAGPTMDVARPFDLEMTAVRGAANDVVTVATGEALLLHVYVTPQPGAVAYEIAVKGDRGEIGRRRVTDEQTTEPVPLMLRGLEPGQYDVIIEGVRADDSRTSGISKRFILRR